MGKKLSYLQDEESLRVLGGNDLKAVAKYMKSDGCKNVFVMTGAGISTSAGIPDFRTPGTGLYSNLAKLKLPYAEAVFELNYFRRNPHPFFVLANELWPGRYRPTLAHSFIKLLHSENRLHTSFTQNIDMLERRAGVPPEKIVEAHGSFATQRCIDCKAPYDGEKLKRAVKEQSIPTCQKCNGYVKPDIVFFGEGMPEQFHRSVNRLRSADLLFVMGTSLTVYPFAALVDLVPEDCPRVLFNIDEVGSFHRPDDVVCLGKCDDLVRELCKELGWEEELDETWEATADSIDLDWVEEADAKDNKDTTGEERVEQELEKITSGIKNILDLADKPSTSQSEDSEDQGDHTHPSTSPETESSNETSSEAKLTEGKL